MIAAQQKEDLRLKCISFAVAVEIGEKRILLKDLQKNFGVEHRLKKAGQGGLADSDDPFNGNIHGWAPGVKWVKDTIIKVSGVKFQVSSFMKENRCEKEKALAIWQGLIDHHSLAWGITERWQLPFLPAS